MPGYDFDSWLTSHAVYANAAPVLRDRLTCGELVGWLGGDGLDAAQRRGIADAALECVDALTLAALDAMAGDDADALAGDLDWPQARVSARAACRLIAVGDGRKPATVARGLRALHALWLPHYLAAEARDSAPLRHPTARLADDWIEANAPPAKLDRWLRRTMPRLVTTERQGELPSIEAPNMDASDGPQIPGLGEIESAPRLVELPGFEAPDATPSGVVPASWLALIDGFSRAHPDPREWQRALRLLIEVVSTPDPRERVGTVRVHLPVGGPHGLIRRLWPNDSRVREHDAHLRRAAGLAATAALPASGGRLYVPVQFALFQRHDVLAFNVTYPLKGGNGATFDRDAFRRYGMHPHTFRVYLAAVWALDARHLRERDGDAWLAALPLDALAALATYPDVPRDQVGRDNLRRTTREALGRLARDGSIGGYDLAGRGSRQRLALWRPPRQLVRPSNDGRACG